MKHPEINSLFGESQSQTVCQNRREIRVSCHDSFDLSVFLARSRKGRRDLSPKVVINANTVVFEGGTISRSWCGLENCFRKQRRKFSYEWSWKLKEETPPEMQLDKDLNRGSNKCDIPARSDFWFFKKNIRNLPLHYFIS